MESITIENIESNIQQILEHGQLNSTNLERLNILCKAKHNLHHLHRKFTEEDAVEWTKGMNPPARWKMEDTTALLKKMGYDLDPVEFFATMNALFSDYGKTLVKHGADKPELWAEMARDFICDADAREGKVGRYWREIVRH